MEEKLADPPAGLLPYLAKENHKHGFRAAPRQVALPETLRSAYRDAVKTLPDKVRRLVEDKLFAIYAVEDLGSSGFGQVLSDREGHVTGGFVVVDVGAMSRGANQWASWREHSPFGESDEVYISAVLEYPPNDTPANTLQYLLLHEFGHIIAVTHDVLPRWNSKSAQEEAAYPFAALSWREVKDALVYTREFEFTGRSRLRFYATAEKLQPATSAPGLYDDWSRTPFPTLYASLDVNEDFADSFASYVHTRMLGRPWKVVLRQSGQTRIIGECWSEQRCVEKRRFFEQLLR